jgi:hypothetical protein
MNRWERRHCVQYSIRRSSSPVKNVLTNAQHGAELTGNFTLLFVIASRGTRARRSS